MRYVWDKEKDAWVYPSERPAAASPARSDMPAPMIMSDIADYQSIVDRSVITSRSHHREHLKRHDCVEVGNDFTPPTHHELSPAERIHDIKQSVDKYV